MINHNQPFHELKTVGACQALNEFFQPTETRRYRLNSAVGPTDLTAEERMVRKEGCIFEKDG